MLWGSLKSWNRENRCIAMICCIFKSDRNEIRLSQSRERKIHWTDASSSPGAVLKGYCFLITKEQRSMMKYRRWSSKSKYVFIWFWFPNNIAVLHIIISHLWLHGLWFSLARIIHEHVSVASYTPSSKYDSKIYFFTCNDRNFRNAFTLTLYLRWYNRDFCIITTIGYSSHVITSFIMMTCLSKLQS